MYDSSHHACESCGSPHEPRLMCGELQRRKREIERLKNEVRVLSIKNEKLRDYIAANMPQPAAGGRSVAQQMEDALGDLQKWEQRIGEGRRVARPVKPEGERDVV